MRKLLAVALLVLAGGSGCTMCDHPYDDCYPVIHDDTPQGGMVDGGFAANQQASGASQARVAQARSAQSAARSAPTAAY